ncbi:unnamed protein product, partial [Effrenium voratum]
AIRQGSAPPPKKNTSEASWNSRMGPTKGIRFRSGAPPNPPTWQYSREDVRAFYKWERKVWRLQISSWLPANEAAMMLYTSLRGEAEEETEGNRLLERARLSADAQRLVLISSGHRLDFNYIVDSLMYAFPDHKPTPPIYGRDGQPIRSGHGAPYRTTAADLPYSSSSTSTAASSSAFAHSGKGDRYSKGQGHSKGFPPQKVYNADHVHFEPEQDQEEPPQDPDALDPIEEQPDEEAVDEENDEPNEQDEAQPDEATDETQLAEALQILTVTTLGRKFSETKTIEVFQFGSGGPMQASQRSYFPVSLGGKYMLMAFWHQRQPKQFLMYMTAMINLGLASRTWLTLRETVEEEQRQKQAVAPPPKQDVKTFFARICIAFAILIHYTLGFGISATVATAGHAQEDVGASLFGGSIDKAINSLAGDFRPGDGRNGMERHSEPAQRLRLGRRGRVAAVKDTDIKEILGQVRKVRHVYLTEYEIYLASSRTRPTASRVDIMETYAGAALISQEAHLYGLKATIPVDYNTGFNLGEPESDQACNQMVHNLLVMIHELECKPWTLLQDNCNFVNRKEELEQWRESVRPQMNQVVKWCYLQHNEGRYYILENPQTSRLWLEAAIQKLQADTGAVRVTCHSGAYGARDSKGNLIRKSFSFMSNNPDLLRHLQERLPPEQLRECVKLEGAEVTKSQAYPPGLVHAILRGDVAKQINPSRFAKQTHQIMYQKPSEDLDSWKRVLDNVTELFSNTAKKTLIIKESDRIYPEIADLVPWQITRVQVVKTPVTHRQPAHVPFTHRGSALRYNDDQIEVTSEDVGLIHFPRKRFPRPVSIGIFFFGYGDLRPSGQPHAPQAQQEPDTEKFHGEIRFPGLHNVDRSTKASVARLHRNLGHISNNELIKLMAMNGITSEAVTKCIKTLVCDTCSRNTKPDKPNPAHFTDQFIGQFADTLETDIAYVRDLHGQSHAFLGMLIGTIERHNGTLKLILLKLIDSLGVIDRDVGFDLLNDERALICGTTRSTFGYEDYVPDQEDLTDLKHAQSGIRGAGRRATDENDLDDLQDLSMITDEDILPDTEIHQPLDNESNVITELWFEPGDSTAPYECYFALDDNGLRPVESGWDGSPDITMEPHHQGFYETYVNHLDEGDHISAVHDDSDQDLDDMRQGPARPDSLSRQESKALEKELPWREIMKMDEESIAAFVESAKEEERSWMSFKSVEPVPTKEAEKILADPATKRRVMPTRAYRDKNKGVPPLKAKCRVVVQGHQDPDLRSISRQAPTPGRLSEMIILMVFASGANLRAFCNPIKWYLWVADAKTAFLQGSQDVKERPNDIFIRGPRDPILDRAKVIRRMRSIGFVQMAFDAMTFLFPSPSNPAVPCCIVSIYVDDFLATYSQVASCVSLSNKGKETTYGNLQDMYECIDYLKEFPDTGITLPGIHLNEQTTLVAFSDSSWANAQNCASQHGCLVFAADNVVTEKQCMGVLLDWKTNRSARVCRSTLAAEAIAADTAADRTVYANLFISQILTSLPSHRAPEILDMHLVTDCKSLYDVLISPNSTTEDKRSLVYVRSTQESFIPARIRWVPTTHQLADVLTKLDIKLRLSFK